MGIPQVQDRDVCSETNQEATGVLESIPRPQCTRNRCFSSKVTKEGTVYKLTMTINTQDSEKDKRRQSQGGSIDYAVVANPVLVGPTAEDETNENTDTNETQSTMVLSRIDVIFQKRMAEGLTIEDVDFLTQSTRKKTHKAYDHG